MTVFINKGDQPLTALQAAKRGKRMYERELAIAGARPTDLTSFLAIPKGRLKQRMKDILTALPNSPTEIADYVADWEDDNDVNAVNSLFNHQLVAHADAVERLAKYRKADGRDEITEDQPTDDLDENGDPVMVPIVIGAAIDPLPAEVEQNTYDEDGNLTGTEMVPNPDIVKDDAERAAAQATIDAIPQEVKDFQGI